MIYPFQAIQDGTLRISKTDLSSLMNNNHMNYYISFIFLFILFKFIWLNFDFFQEEVYDYTKLSFEINFPLKIYLFTKYVYSLTTKFLFIVLFFICACNSVSVFYQSINLKVENSYVNIAFGFSRKVLQSYQINSGYGLFRVMTGVSGRPELEIKYLNRQKQWKNINFIYKPSHIPKHKPLINIPHQPRIDWQIWFSALSKEINTETWLIILTGKIFEKNPIILDLLGYYVREKNFYYKYSFVDRILDYIYKGEKFKMIDTIDMIKIEKYYYFFTNKNEMAKTGSIWKKIHQNEFMPATDIKIFKSFFDTMKLPFNKRKIRFSIFQLIPVLDFVVFPVIIWIFFRLIMI